MRDNRRASRSIKLLNVSFLFFFFFHGFSEDMYPPDSVEQLQKAGIEFQKHEEYGILPNDFAELMITSGLVLAPETKWISFHRWVVLSFYGEYVSSIFGSTDQFISPCVCVHGVAKLSVPCSFFFL